MSNEEAIAVLNSLYHPARGNGKSEHSFMIFEAIAKATEALKVMSRIEKYYGENVDYLEDVRGSRIVIKDACLRKEVHPYE